MIVYHGTNADFKDIDLKKGARFKDFGQGFYVTPNRETAQRMARKKAKIIGGVPIIISYELDESALTSSNLNILSFPKKATTEWVIFVSHNRERRTTQPPYNYDVVKGPIADDGVALQLGRLRLHADEAEQIAHDLQDRYLDQQFCFRTQRSLRHLKKITVCELK